MKNHNLFSDSHLFLKISNKKHFTVFMELFLLLTVQTLSCPYKHVLKLTMTRKGGSSLPHYARVQHTQRALFWCFTRATAPVPLLAAPPMEDSSIINNKFFTGFFIRPLLSSARYRHRELFTSTTFYTADDWTTELSWCAKAMMTTTTMMCDLLE